MKRCSRCEARAYLADVHCRRCGAAIEPPPPLWIQHIGRVFWVCIGFVFVAQLSQLTRAIAATDAGHYLVAHGGEIAGFLLAFVVASLVGLYFAFHVMIDLGDWIDLKVQQWRADRFRKYGW